MKHFFVVLLVLVSSCAHQRTQVAPNPGSMIPTAIITHHFFLLGFAQTRLENAQFVCGDRRVTTIESSQQPLDFLLALVTFGIYMPKTLKIYCDDGSNK